MRHIPNILTVLRLLVTPIILERIWAGDLDVALILFFVTGMTDTIDGTLARRFGWSSRFGQLVDPLADKTLLTGTFLVMGIRGFLPPWVVWVVIGRDVAILAVAAVLKAAGKLGEFPPSVFGKLSTLVQLLTAGAVLLRWPADPSLFYYATALLAIVSAAHYALLIRQKLN